MAENKLVDQDCIFCRIVANESPSHRIWEDENHLAFLSIYPNTPGVTVVIPKAHRPSYVFDNDDETVCSLMKAARKVAGMLDQRLEGVGRTGVIFEGYGVDHLHAKLFPMHGTGDGSSFRRIESKGMDRFFERYEGYLSSHDAMRADDDALSAMARRIRGE